MSLKRPKKGTTYVGYTSQSTPMLKTTGNSSKKDNLSMSNSFSALNEEEEEVENVYDESSNLIQNTKAGGSSSFTAAAASLPKLGSSTEPKVCNAGPQPALLDWYGYSTFDEFPAGTDEETLNNETTYKNKTVGNTGKNILFYEDTIEKQSANSLKQRRGMKMKKKGYTKPRNCADQEKRKTNV
ncbi:hypothetical protein Tco_1299332 [Tanacetum coccineum]